MPAGVTTYGRIIDQRAMSAGERLELAIALRELWWDCHRDFRRPVVDLDALGLTATSLEALATDLDEAGYPLHASATRGASSPRAHVMDRPAPTHWRPRVHSGIAVRR